jgi:hypothetical protein
VQSIARDHAGDNASERWKLPNNDRSYYEHGRRTSGKDPADRGTGHKPYFPLTGQAHAESREALARRRRRNVGESDMKLVERFDRAVLEKSPLVAESSEFAIYDVGNDTYALVHRHEAVAWQGVTISGDGLFRIADLLGQATRALYRNVAVELSKERNR